MEFADITALCILVGLLIMFWNWGKHTPNKHTLTTLPPEPTDKGHWYDGIHEMD
jgi:hypothetical protein